MLLRHRPARGSSTQYDANNTYQYIINREETQLSWVGDRRSPSSAATVADAADASPSGGHGRRATAATRAVIEEDARDAQAFVDRWRPRVEAMANARHRGMLRVILGETLEQKRFFEQALAGRTDLLGRRTDRRRRRASARCCHAVD